ncbi:hypothetical protein H9L12_02680 [Sphingomonas rhizophila]|uniref:Uncharacterized protein n=1 Tax=Sphingomonas rhizophila TaxID=2071607 RepID=A0A7G9SCE6_9SPHN|nr:hypothetical protein [Sphingomonas rhizophila]QNN65521.1 hypothetical protein H9L12_02680 [Sphingomonas rhizophila]
MTRLGAAGQQAFVKKNDESASKPKSPWNRREKILVVATFFLLLFDGFFDRSTLITRLPFLVTLGSSVIVAAPFYWMAWKFAGNTSDPSHFRRFFVSMGMLIMAPFIGPYFSRQVAVHAAFFNFPSTLESTLATVMSMRGRGRFGPSARAQFSPETRKFLVHIDEQLYEQLDVYRYPGRDCLIFTVATGRWGVRKVTVPNILDDSLGISAYRRCPHFTPPTPSAP